MIFNHVKELKADGKRQTLRSQLLIYFTYEW
jgi:hypothetical protein